MRAPLLRRARSLGAFGPLFAIVAAAACALVEDRAPDGGASPAPGSPASGATALAGRGHQGSGAFRCARCHTDADRAQPAWREVSMSVGHDIERWLRGRTTCTCCHVGEVRGFGEPLSSVCAECHDEIRVRISAMGSMHCVSCHDPTAAGGAILRESAWECLKCHANDQSERAAIFVHSSEDCANCHRPHADPWTVQRPCSDCHVGPAPQHGGAEGVAACELCHRPHEVGGAASSRCAECHERRNPDTFTERTTFAGHDRCTSCHAPHAAGKGTRARGCTTCHAAVLTMPGRGAKEHAACESCHSRHDVRKSAPRACVSCHAAVHPEHPDPTAQGCVGCHDPHPSSRGAARRNACSSCHRGAASDTAFHAGGSSCTGCHREHSFRAESPAICAGCHARQSAAGVHGGHRACESCHNAHEPSAAKQACSSCHEAEATTAPKGHAACSSCHAAHPASPAPKAQCTTCHAQKKAGPHAPVGCASCHRTHGPDAPTGPAGPPQPPPCSQCHEPAKLGGLHAAAGHGSCASCHTGHGPPKSERAACLFCHTDRKDHEPMARVCAGCHAFGKAR
jgi:hypothetical protein